MHRYRSWGRAALAAADEMKHLWDSCMFPQVFFYTLGTAYLGDVLIREKIPAPGRKIQEVLL